MGHVPAVGHLGEDGPEGVLPLAPDGNRVTVDAIDTAGVGDAFPGTLAAHIGGGLAVRPAAQRSA